MPTSATQAANSAISPSASGQRLWPWYVVEWLNSFAATTYLWCIPFYVVGHLNGTKQQNLWLMAGWGITYAGFSMIAGRLVENWGPRLLILRMSFASMVTALLALLTLRFPSLWLLFAAMAAYNFTSSQLWPALESAITRCKGKLLLSTRTSLYNLTWSSAGFVAAFFASGIIWLGPQAIFIIPAVASLLAAVAVVALTTPRLVMAHDHVPDDPIESSPHPLPAAGAKALLHMAWIANAMGYVCINVIMAVMPNLTGTDRASLGSVWKFTAVVGFVLFWKWRGWHYKPAWLFALYAGMGLSFFTMLSWPSLPVLIASQAMFGLCASFVYSSSLYYAMHVSSGAGGHAGIHEALIGLGIAAGSAAGAVAAIGATSLTPIALSVVTLLIGGGMAMGILAVRRVKVPDYDQAQGSQSLGLRATLCLISRDTEGFMDKPSKTKSLRLGVLISGGGTTLQNLADLIAAGTLNANIACVISSNHSALGLQRAKNIGVPAFVVTRKECVNDAGAFSDRIATILKDHHVDLVIMAGFLCLWHIPAEFEGRVMNIHPALLPSAFGGPGMYGQRVHAAVIANGEKVSGCTVHFADNQYDHGPIILQHTCPVLPDDTPETLAHRVFEQECIAYPEAIRMFAEGKLNSVSKVVPTPPSAV